jgi:CHAD domain-containing protein
LRYGVEGLASLFKPRKVKRYVRSLSNLQDALGQANDASTAQRLLAEIEPPAPFAAFARGWFAARRQGDPLLLRTLVARLSESKRFWSRKPAKQAAQV